MWLSRPLLSFKRDESASVHCACSRAERCIERHSGRCDNVFPKGLNGAVLHWCPMLCISLPLEAAGAFVSQWVSVSEWAQGHGWLMNDYVFITIPVPQSHHRDIHSPLQVSEKLHRHPGSQIRRVRGDSAVPSFSGDNGG